MQFNDPLIQSVYAAASASGWQAARQRVLALLMEHLGASGGAWLTSGPSGLGGCYTESLHSGFSRSGLQALRFPEGQPLVREDAGPPLRILRYPHARSPLFSLLALRWPVESARTPPESALLEQAVMHSAEAAELAMRLFVQRDEWLREMGRQNRGAAALVDARGTVHAASDRFLELTAAATAATPQTFALPEALLEQGGAFVREGLHIRVEAGEGLYLVHVRRPLALDILSPREQQIARGLGEGKTFKSIARNCGIAVSTVANHATRIYRKLGVYRREELVEAIRSSGLRQGS